MLYIRKREARTVRQRTLYSMQISICTGAIEREKIEDRKCLKRLPYRLKFAHVLVSNQTLSFLGG